MARLPWAAISLSLSVEPEAMIGGAGVEHLFDRAFAGEAGIGLFGSSLAGMPAQSSVPASAARQSLGEARKRMENLLGNTGICPVGASFRGAVGRVN